MATAVFTTVSTKAIGDPINVADWSDMLRDNLNQLAGAHANLLTNGGLEVWQRGAGAFTAVGYTADRWYISAISAGTVTVTLDNAIVDGSATSMKVVTTSGSSNNIIYNHTELLQGRGKAYSVSARVYQSAANGVSLELSGVSGNTTAVTSATTSAFVTLSATFTTGGTDAYLRVVLRFPQAGTYYVDNVMLTIGPAPAPYQPLHPQEDLARCQRYYEVHGGVNPSLGINGYNAAAATMGQFIPFAVAKGGTPTMTKNGTFAVTNCGQPAVSGPCPSGYNLSATVTALGAASFNANSVDDTVTAQWDPP